MEPSLTFIQTTCLLHYQQQTSTLNNPPEPIMTQLIPKTNQTRTDTMRYLKAALLIPKETTLVSVITQNRL
jgi:hypothetical protein